MSAVGEFGNVVLCLISDGLVARRDPGDILRDIRDAALARPGLHVGSAEPEMTESLAKARSSVLAEVSANAAPRLPIIEAKLDLLIQVAKRDALIEAAERDRRAR